MTPNYIKYSKTQMYPNVKSVPYSHKNHLELSACKISFESSNGYDDCTD